MKRLRTSALAVSVASAPLAFAVERPTDLDQEPHQLKGQSERVVPLDQRQAENWAPEKKIAIVEAVPGQQGEQPMVEPQVPQAPAPQVIIQEVPYLGVGGSPVDEVLSVHLGLDHGVVVQQVHQGSGAFKAGLRKHDILLSFDGQKIATPLDLRDAVRNCKVGDQVAVEFIRKGSKVNEEVVLESRPAGLPGFMPQGRRGMGGMGQLHQVWPGLGEGMPEGAFEQIERLRNLMDKEFDEKRLGLKLGEVFDGALPDDDGAIDVNIDAQSTVTWSDGQGSITMNMRDGKTEVQVRDNTGAVVFEGPWETPEDKAAAVPEIRDRIENMGVQRQGNQFKFLMEDLPGGR